MALIAREHRVKMERLVEHTNEHKMEEEKEIRKKRRKKEEEREKEKERMKDKKKIVAVSAENEPCRSVRSDLFAMR